MVGAGRAGRVREHCTSYVQGHRRRGPFTCHEKKLSPHISLDPQPGCLISGPPSQLCCFPASFQLLPLNMAKAPIFCTVGDAHKSPVKSSEADKTKSQYTPCTNGCIHQCIQLCAPGCALEWLPGSCTFGFLVSLPLPLALKVPDLVKILNQQHRRCGRKVSEIQDRSRLAFLRVRDKRAV